MTRPILDDLPFCLARATLGFRKFNDETLRAVGLDRLAPGLASVLHAVEELKVCTVNRLVEKTHVPNGTLTGLLDTLQDEGYVQRVPNPKDGRSWLIRLTKKGARLCAKLHERHRAAMEILSGVLTKKEMAELARLLEKVTKCMHGFGATVTEPPANAIRRTRTAPRASQRRTAR
jgi:DNA-binding MarR family transcriptional regulator